jgi:hypothetical protein
LAPLILDPRIENTYLVIGIGEFKIIIPNEEQTKCYCGHTTYCDCGPEEPKQETLEKYNYLQGFINQFEEEGEHQELSNDNWTVSQFLKWMKINNFIIVKDENKK